MVRPLLVAFAAFCLMASPTTASQETLGVELSAIRRPSPFVIGGLRLDIPQAQVNSGVVPRRGELLIVPAAYARTAVLTEPAQSTGLVRGALTAPAGSLLHEVEFVRRLSHTEAVAHAMWCGSMGAQPSFVNRSPVFCLVEDDGRSRAWLVRGVSWLAVSPDTGFESHWLDRVSLEASPLPDQPATNVSVRLDQITQRDVFLRLYARRGEEEEVLMFTVRRPIENGAVLVPLWSHSLLLTVVQGGVTVRLSADGDGTGLAEIGQYPTL